MIVTWIGASLFYYNVMNKKNRDLFYLAKAGYPYKSRKRRLIKKWWKANADVIFDNTFTMPEALEFGQWCLAKQRFENKVVSKTRKTTFNYSLDRTAPWEEK